MSDERLLRELVSTMRAVKDALKTFLYVSVWLAAAVVILVGAMAATVCIQIAGMYRETHDVLRRIETISQTVNVQGSEDPAKSLARELLKKNGDL
jgi:hypothetical protein